MKALVTGGGGFLGRRIVNMLIARGDRVAVVGRRSYPDLERKGVHCFQGDLRDSDAAVEACEGVDVVFHVAALAGVWGPRRSFLEHNVKGTANVIRGCLENKVEYLVYTSSPSVVIGTNEIENGSEELPYLDRYLAGYPESKARAERMVLEANGWEMVPNEPAAYVGKRNAPKVKHLKTCALRPHLIWGPGDPHLLPRILEMAAKGHLPIIGSGKNKVDMTYIDNAAHAHLLAADELAGTGRCAGKAYFIGDDEPVEIWTWMNDLLNRLDLPVIKRRLPYPLARILGATSEGLHRLIPALGEPALTRFTVLQMAQSHWFSHERAERDFGYTPIVSAEEGLERFVAWYKER